MSTSPETSISVLESSDSRPRSLQARTDLLVVCRDPETRIVLEKTCFLAQLGLVRAANAKEALAYLEANECAVALVSIESPESVELLESLRSTFPRLRTLAVATSATAELVRDVFAAGAADFLFGSFKSKALAARLEGLYLAAAGKDDAGAAPPARRESDRRRRAEAAPAETPRTEIISRNKRTQRVLEIARRVASTDSTVLIQGESGTGKELLARYIHERSPRASELFVDVNCGALPENLLESQLFGHEKGSFTGASQRQLGLFEVANRGTIFLDEIGEMSLDMQVKLLRILQQQEFRRIGGSQQVQVDVRVLAATNRDLKDEVDKGRFRRDLYYRLNVIGLELPPLRERPEEIPQLVSHFCEHYVSRRGLGAKDFSEEAVAELQKFRWEGNIRELENAVERLLLLSGGERVEVRDIQEHLAGEPHADLGSEFAPSLTLDEVKKLHIARVLAANGGNKMKTARILKINVKTLYNLIKSLEIPS